MVFRGGTTASCDTEWPYPFKDKMQYKMISLFEHCYRFDILKRESASTDMSSKHHGPGRPLTEWVYLSSAYFCIWVWTLLCKSTPGTAPVQATKKSGRNASVLSTVITFHTHLTPVVTYPCCTSSERPPRLLWYTHMMHMKLQYLKMYEYQNLMMLIRPCSGYSSAAAKFSLYCRDNVIGHHAAIHPVHLQCIGRYSAST